MLAMLFLATALAAPTAHQPLPDDATMQTPAIALGGHGGRWGSAFGSGFRLEVPVLQFAGVRLLHVTQYANTAAPGEGYMPTNGAGADLFLRTPLLSDRYRIRLGGGPRVAVDGEHTLAFGGGGFVGVELLVTPRLALTTEVGGQGGSGALDLAEGYSVMGGTSVYLGR